MKAENLGMIPPIASTTIASPDAHPVRHEVSHTLPAELWTQILSHVSFAHLWTSCRLVLHAFHAHSDFIIRTEYIRLSAAKNLPQLITQAPKMLTDQFANMALSTQITSTTGPPTTDRANQIKHNSFIVILLYKGFQALPVQNILHSLSAGVLILV